MGSVNMDCDTKRELDDSGCVQDDGMSNCQVGLLDLSDDVLLYILRHCSPRDLKALGYSCPRLGRLVQERSLWRRVDARAEPCSGARLAWFIDNTLHDDTQLLMISGYARAAEGCLGLINVTRDEAEEEKKSLREQLPAAPSNISVLIVSDIPEELHQIPIPVHLERQHARFFVTAQRTTHLPRFRGFPSWPDSLARCGPQACCGPQFSVGAPLMQQLTDTCPRLSSLVLDYCCIDCNTTSLSHFPRGLKKLSLRGCRCYNMTIDKSFLFKIQDYLPVLESLDVSECEWMDPATLLPLSKLPALQELYMRDCHKLAEFVAYASLTARYGFRTLRVLDLRGSPVGDSEVSALGWLPQLERLWLSAARARRRTAHAHYKDDAKTRHRQLAQWEMTEPEYFKCRSSAESVDVLTMVEDRPCSETTVGDHDTEKQRPKPDVSGPKESKKRKTDEDLNEEIQAKRKRVSEDEGNCSRREEERHRNSPDCIVDCIKIDQLIDVGELRRGRQNEVIVIANSAKVRSPSTSRHPDNYVCFRRNQQPVYVEEDGRNVNEGASTSRDNKDKDNENSDNSDNNENNGSNGNNENNGDNGNNDNDTENEDDNSDNEEKYVHFRKNQEPVYVNCAPEQRNRREPLPPVQYQIEPRHHVLYVSVGPQINTYRFPRDTAEMERQINLNFMPSHVDSSSLVTDFAVRRFGRADGEDVNIIHIGPNGPMVVGQANGSRPDRSNLRYLSVTGYRNITDRSLVHLASAAPNLTFIDFRETNVSEAGADTFRTLRPDCELIFSPFIDRKDK